MIEEKQFRSDLYYRLNVFPIRLPPLRERPEDIPLLVRYFSQKYARRMQKRIENIPAAAMRKLARWHWPGNVRELQSYVRSADGKGCAHTAVSTLSRTFTVNFHRNFH